MLFLIVLFAFALCYVTVPLVAAAAWRIGAVDVPSDWRRMHPHPIPRAGGIAVFGAFLTAVLRWGHTSAFLTCALSGGALLLTVGLADDIFCLNAWMKLFFQVAATVAAILGSGLTSGWQTPVAVLWVVALTNAHNFIDGLDGLLAGVSAIECMALCVSFFAVGLYGNAVPPLLLGAACLAFRQFNRYPAQIFAGDCGSGSIGFLLGMFSLPLFGECTVHIGFLAPFLIFAYPLTDLFGAVVRRLLRGSSPFRADRGHLHHRVIAAGCTQPQCCVVFMLITAVLSVVGVLIGTERFLLAASLSCLAAVAVLMRIRRYIVHFA